MPQLLTNSEGRVELSLRLTKNHTMKTNWRSGGTAPHVLDLGTKWRWLVSFTPRPLYLQGNSPHYSLDRMLGRPQSRSGRDSEVKNSQYLTEIKPYNSGRPACSQSLYRLKYHGSYLQHTETKCEFRSAAILLYKKKKITSTEVTYSSKIYCHIKLSYISTLAAMLISLPPQNFTRSPCLYYWWYEIFKNLNRK
jgi:hypothetical protein